MHFGISVSNCGGKSMRHPPACCDRCGHPVAFPAALLSVSADEFLCHDCMIKEEAS